MTVRISSKRPKGENDGLQAWESDLRERQEPLVIVAQVYPRQLIDKLDEDDDPHAVVLGIARVEVLDGDEALAAGSLMNGAYEKRTGREPLPFGVVDEEVEE